MSDNFFTKPQYPLDAFLLVAREAAYEVLENVQSPDALVGMTSISAMTLACQPLINVKLPLGKVCGVSQNLLAIIESGDGKTTVSNYVLKPFMDSDARAKERYNEAKEIYEIKIESWKAKSKGIRRAISKAASIGESIVELEEQLTVHMKLKPKKPRLRYFLRQNNTPKALMEALEGDGESIAIWNDEGDELFKSATMSHFGLLNRVWDSPLVMTIDRAGGEQILARNPRGSVSILTQWKPFKNYVDKRGSSARGTGHWARYLVGKPNSMQGYRKVPKNEQVWTYLPKFHARICELIDKYLTMVESGKVELETIEFSDDAKACWFDLAQQTENMLREGEYLSDINDHAAKLMEILGRLAATMHYFSGASGKITLDTLERAFRIICWHIEEFRCLFSPQYVIPQDQSDAHKVAMWLRTRIWQGCGLNSYVAKNYLLRNGPVRNRDRLNAALGKLSAQSAIWLGQNTKNKQCFVNLFDSYFATMAVVAAPAATNSIGGCFF